MIPAEWLAEFQAAIRCIAPELERVYITMHPENLPTPHGAGAYVTIMPDLLLRQHLIDSGAWRGPGEVIVLVEPPEVFASTLADVLHELAHLLPARPMLDDFDPSPKLLEANLRMFERSASPARAELPPWFGHGNQFIRIAVHVHFRAVWHRHYSLLSLEDMTVAGETYGLSPAREYKAALGDEPARMLDATFKEILAEPAPEAFTKLFQDDTAHWQKGQVA